MTVEKNKTIARRWFEEMWSEPDPDVADEIVHPDYAPDWVPIDAKGPAQIKHEIKYFRSAFPDLKYEIVDMAALEDRVWVRYRATATQDGPAWGFAPTGKQVTFEGAAILYIDPDGKIVDQWGAFCFYDMLVDLGLVPPFWELKEKLS